MSLCPNSFQPSRILELGCGTGHFSRLLMERFQNASITLTDISQEMIEVSKETLSFGRFQGVLDWHVLDASSPMGNAEFDCICSSTLVQWMPELSIHINAVSKALANGGIYLFSGFSPDNFSELNQLLRQAPFSRREFPGHRLETVKNILVENGLNPVVANEERLTRYYGSFNRFLNLLRQTGASGRTDGLLTRKKLQLLTQRYTKSYKMGGGIYVTWRPWYIVAAKTL